MTYDIAVWKQSGDVSDEAATLEFARRADESDARYPNYRPAIAELIQLADMLEVRFPEAPWEDLRGSLDGDFLYLTVGGADAGSAVEAHIAEIAPRLGLLVYSPIGEGVVRS